MSATVPYRTQLSSATQHNLADRLYRLFTAECHDSRERVELRAVIEFQRFHALCTAIGGCSFHRLRVGFSQTRSDASGVAGHAHRSIGHGTDGATSAHASSEQQQNQRNYRFHTVPFFCSGCTASAKPKLLAISPVQGAHSHERRSRQTDARVSISTQSFAFRDCTALKTLECGKEKPPVGGKSNRGFCLSTSIERQGVDSHSLSVSIGLQGRRAQTNGCGQVMTPDLSKGCWGNPVRLRLNSRHC